MQSAENLLPHRRPMRLIHRVEGFDGHYGAAEADITVDTPFLDESGVLEHVAFAELIAQAFAACKGFEGSQTDTPPQKGLLVAIKKLTLSGGAAVGDTLRVTVEKDGDFDSFTMVSGAVFKGNQELATASLRVWTE